jgi:hypothetical protein
MSLSKRKPLRISLYLLLYYLARPYKIGVVTKNYYNNNVIHNNDLGNAVPANRRVTVANAVSLSKALPIIIIIIIIKTVNIHHTKNAILSVRN